MKLKSFILGTSALACGLAVVPAVAQDDDIATDDVIVVTAGKREQTLQEVPISVSVTSADTIEKAAIIDIIDLQKVVPSLRVTQLQASGNTSFSIRGFGNGTNNNGLEPSVGVFVDGVFRSKTVGALADLPVLERIEVLRGPQNTLYGKNTSAGVVSIITAKPQFEAGGVAEVTFGKYNQTIYKGTFTGPISDSQAIRISGSMHKRDGYYDNLTVGSKPNERDRFSLRGQWLAEGEKLTLRAIGDWDKADENCCGAVTILNGPSTQAIGAPPPFGLGFALGDDTNPFGREVLYNVDPTNDVEGKGFSLQADYDFDFATLTSITALRSQQNNYNIDADFTAADIVADNANNLDVDSFTQELRLTSAGDGQVSWLLGATYGDENLAFDRTVVYGDDIRGYVNLLMLGATGGTLDLPTFESLTNNAPNTFFQAGQGLVQDKWDQEDINYSVFGQADFELSDRLVLTAGLAYINDEKNVVSDVILDDPFSELELIEDVNGDGVLTAANDAATNSQIADSTNFGGLTTACGLGALPFSPGNVGLVLAAPACGGPFMGAPGSVAFPAYTAQIGAAVAGADFLANPGLNPFTGLAALQFFNVPVNYPNGNETGVFEGDQTVYNLRAAYDMTDNMNVYASYSTGWKAGAVNLSSDSQPADANGIGRFAGPEDSTVIELGLKANFDGGFVNVAIFDQTIEGFQSSIFTGTGFQLANAGEQSVRGAELDVAWAPTPELALTLGAVYLDPEYKSFTKAACVAFDTVNCSNGELFRDLSGTRPAGIHELSFNTSATYTHQFASGMEGFARANYIHESDTPLVENIQGAVASREVNELSASLGIRTDAGLSATLWGRNLTDDEYLLQGFPTTAQAGSFSGYTNAPQTYGVTLRKDW